MHVSILDLWEFPKMGVTLFWGPYKKGSDYLGYYIGVPYFWKLPYHPRTRNPKPARAEEIVRAQASDRRPAKARLFLAMRLAVPLKTK